MMKTPKQMVREAVDAAREGDVRTAERWLEEAHAWVSFLRIRELVLKFLARITDRQLKWTTASTLRKVDANLVPLGAIV